MSFDHAGVKPGLQPTVQEPVTHNMKCKNKNCDSITVVEVKGVEGTGRRMYTCVKCHTSWGVLIGGSIDLG